MTKLAKHSPLALLPSDRAAECVTVLRTLASEHDGALAPTDVVNAARPTESPLHPCFEWNDDAAAELYREHQARQIIRSVYVVTENSNPERQRSQPIRVFVPQHLQADDDSSNRYVPLAKVAREMPIESARRAFLNELDGMLERFGPFPELAALINEMIERAVAAQSEKAAPTRDLLAKFNELHVKRFGVKAAIIIGKDGAIMSKLWRERKDDPITVELLMEAFFKIEDPWLAKVGYSIGIFASSQAKLIQFCQRKKLTVGAALPIDWREECHRLHQGACATAFLHDARTVR